MKGLEYASLALACQSALLDLCLNPTEVVSSALAIDDIRAAHTSRG